MIRTLVAVACLGVVAGCDGGDSAGENGGAVTSVERETWETVVSTLKPGVEPGSDNPCQSGARRCLDLLIAEMNRRADPLAASCDHEVMFAVLYISTTRAVARTVDAGRFEHPESVTHLSAWFARAYFNAFDAWGAGNAAAVPAAWRVAFEAAEERSVRGIGDVLLGMNAHVSRDLPFVVADVVRDPDRDFGDYALVSEVIAEESDRAIGELADRFDADLVGNQIPLVLGGRPTLGAVIAAWRSESWLRGLQLLRASDADRPAVADRIEAEAAGRAELMLPSVRYAPLLDGPERRAAHCAAQRRGG